MTRGRKPKPPERRQRRNRAPTAKELQGLAVASSPKPAGEVRTVRVPALPKLPKVQGRAQRWYAETRAWWRDVWQSPMASEFLEPDKHALIRLAVLVNKFWSDPTAGLAAEIRRQSEPFGLTPLDRHRLQWTIDRDAQKAGPPATTAKPPKPATRGAKASKPASKARASKASKEPPDPRENLRVVVSN